MDQADPAGQASTARAACSIFYLPTEFSANWVRDRFHDRLQLAWKIARSEVRKVNYHGASRSAAVARTCALMTGAAPSQ